MACIALAFVLGLGLGLSAQAGEKLAKRYPGKQTWSRTGLAATCSPDGNPIEHVGVAPDVRVEAGPKAFDDARDPVLEAALARLRKTAEGKRKPAHEE